MREGPWPLGPPEALAEAPAGTLYRTAPDTDAEPLLTLPPPDVRRPIDLVIGTGPGAGPIWLPSAARADAPAGRNEGSVLGGGADGPDPASLRSSSATSAGFCHCLAFVSLL